MLLHCKRFAERTKSPGPACEMKYDGEVSLNSKSTLSTASADTPNSWIWNITLEFSSEDQQGPSTSLTLLQWEAGEEQESQTGKLPAVIINCFSSLSLKCYLQSLILSSPVVSIWSQYYSNMKKKSDKCSMTRASTTLPQLSPSFLYYNIHKLTGKL